MIREYSKPYRVRLLSFVAPGLMISALLLPAPAGADSSTHADTSHALTSASVVVDGVELFEVRGILAYPAKKRATEIAARIKEIARNPKLSPDAITITEADIGSRISLGEQPILYVLDVDAQFEQVDRKVLATIYAKRIGEAIETYRRDRTSEYLGRSALYALAATIGLAAFLWLGGVVFRRIDTVLDRIVKSKLEGLEAQSFRILSAAHLWGLLRGVRHLIWTLAVLITTILYLDFVLQLFPWTRFAHLLNMVVNPLRTMGEDTLAIVPDLVFLVILVFVTRYVLKAIRLPFLGISRGTMTVAGFEREWAYPTYRLVRLLVIAFAAVVAYPYVPGSGSDAFKGISIFLGVMFSLGSTSVIGNIVAGYSMIYRRAFRVGDCIRVDAHVGEVTESRLLVTHLRTSKNEQIIIPNSIILSSSIVNYSTQAREGKLILHVTIGIGYETPWRQVEAMLLQAADRTEAVAKDPKPFVLQNALGDFCVTYELNVFCTSAQDAPRVYSRLYANILDVFNEYGVQIMTPAYDRDPEEPKIVPKNQWYTAPANGLPAHHG